MFGKKMRSDSLDEGCIFDVHCAAIRKILRNPFLHQFAKKNNSDDWIHARVTKDTQEMIEANKFRILFLFTT